MTTQTMLEKMAKAYDNEARPLRRNVRHFQSWSRKDRKDREDQVACMRAALQALKEPTEEMVGAAKEHTYDPAWPEEAVAIWQAMIDAILQEKVG